MCLCMLDCSKLVSDCVRNLISRYFTPENTNIVINICNTCLYKDKILVSQEICIFSEHKKMFQDFLFWQWRRRKFCHCLTNTIARAWLTHEPTRLGALDKNLYILGWNYNKMKVFLHKVVKIVGKIFFSKRY